MSIFSSCTVFFRCITNFVIFVGMGVDVTPNSQSASPFKEHDGIIYNFGVYKFNRLKGAQRRILQLDFQTNVMCNVQRGHRNNQFKFEQIERVESEVCLMPACSNVS